MDERNESLVENVGARLKMNGMGWAVMAYLFAGDSVLFAENGG